MFKMQTFNCLSLKISTQNLNLCGQNYIVHKKRDVTLQHFTGLGIRIESTDGNIGETSQSHCRL